MVATMFPVPLGFLRYHNSASLLKDDETACVSGTPPNVTVTAMLLFACMPTTSRLLVPALKLESVMVYGDDDTVPDVDRILSNTMDDGPVPLCVVADAVLDGELVPTELIADTLYVYAVLAASPVLEYVVLVLPVLGTIVDQVVPP